MIALLLVAGVFSAALLGAYVAGIAADVVRAAITDALYRREDVHTVRSLQPPLRDAVRTYPQFRDAAIDDLYDEVHRGEQRG